MRARPTASKESDRLALEADEMGQRLNALKETMKLSREKRAVQSGRIWSSSGKDGGSKKAGSYAAVAPAGRTVTPNRDGIALRQISSDGGSSVQVPAVPLSAAGRATATNFGLPPAIPSTLPTPSPTAPGSATAVSMSTAIQVDQRKEPSWVTGAFTLLSHDALEMTNADVLQTLEHSRLGHAEFFQEIEQFVYNEEEQKLVHQQEVMLNVGRESRPSKVESVTLDSDSSASRPPPKSVSFAFTQAVNLHTAEMATSPTGSYGGAFSFNMDGSDHQTAEMQTVALPNPRWDAFVEALKAATSFNYFDHLLRQLDHHDALTTVHSYQRVLASTPDSE
eukprot:GGOE01040917.1.p1 GENE.GGOE01040917.1~~GGOE01040917.1.p1  ORF type:complete len:336 (+),score=48.52 GGOE01040917.1:75-1082(+)